MDKREKTISPHISPFSVFLLNFNTLGKFISILVLVLLGYNNLFSSEGLIPRKKHYYKESVDSRHRKENELPVIDFLKYRRPYSDEIDYRLKKLTFIPHWQGGPFNDDFCTRYELAYLTGRLFRLMAHTFGYSFSLRPAGPRRYDIKAYEWGREDVRIAIRSGLFHYNGTKNWWKKPVSNGSYIRFLIKFLEEIKKYTPVVKFPIPFPPTSVSALLPPHSDPRFPYVKYAYQTGLISVQPSGTKKWSISRWVTKKEVIESIDRLLFIISGYVEPVGAVTPIKEFPMPTQ